MVLYNVVIQMNNEIEADFMEWFRKQHIPLIISTGYFIGFSLSKQICSGLDAKTTIVCRFFCHNMEDYENYLNKSSEVMRSDFPARFIDKYFIFRTIDEM